MYQLDCYAPKLKYTSYNTRIVLSRNSSRNDRRYIPLAVQRQHSLQKHIRWPLRSSQLSQTQRVYPYHHRYEIRILMLSAKFYFVMSVIYVVFALVWGWVCWKHSQDLLPLQVSLVRSRNNTKSDVSKNYLSGLIGLLVIDMVANLGTRLWISPVLLTNCTASLLLLF